MSVESSSVKVGDADLECFLGGSEGAAVVLLPGQGLGVGYLAGLADALAGAGLRAVRVNPRGAGASTGLSEGLTYHDHAADVAGVIEALGIAPVVVLGHAFGNRIARTLAADRPELVRGVVLVSAGGKVPPTPEVQRAFPTLFSPAASDAEMLDTVRLMAGSPENAARLWERLKDDRAPALAAAQAAAGQATPLEDWWAPQGEVPYLVIQGLSDRVAPVENGRMLKDELGDRVTVVEIPHAGHLQPLEAPQPVADAVIAFIGELVEPTRPTA